MFYGKNLRYTGELEIKLGSCVGFKLWEVLNDRLKKLYFILQAKKKILKVKTGE